MGVGLSSQWNVNDSLTEELHSLTEYLCMCTGGRHHNFWVFLQCCLVYHNINNAIWKRMKCYASDKSFWFVLFSADLFLRGKDKKQKRTAEKHKYNTSFQKHRMTSRRSVITDETFAFLKLYRPCTESLKYLSTNFSAKAYSTYDFSPLFWCTDGRVFNILLTKVLGFWKL